MIPTFATSTKLKKKPLPWRCHCENISPQHSWADAFSLRLRTKTCTHLSSQHNVSQVIFTTASNNASALLILSLVKDLNLFNAQGIPANTWKEIMETSDGEKKLKAPFWLFDWAVSQHKISFGSSTQMMHRYQETKPMISQFSSLRQFPEWGLENRSTMDTN